MATKKVNIDIIAKDKSKRALNNVRGSLDKLKSSVFNVRNALAGLGAGLGAAQASSGRVRLALMKSVSSAT